MRKQFDTLAALVAGVMGKDPLAGDLYLFVSRNRRRAKVLYWDGTGLCLFAKRLEKGRFAAPWKHARDGALRMTHSELALLLEGSEFVGKLPLSPAPFKLGAKPAA
jgi:transposase